MDRNVGAAAAKISRRLWSRPPLAPPLALPWIWRLALALFVVAVLLLPIGFAVRYAAQSGGWWERGFDRFNAEQRTGLPRAELDRAGADLRAYFLSDEAVAAITVVNLAGQEEALFSPREVQHLVDVKRLLMRTYDAAWAALGFVIAFVVGVLYWRRRRAIAALAQATQTAGLAVTGTIVVLAVVALTGFDSAFRQFHLLFFTNDLWQLSNRDRLIQMFPQGFFFETTLLIGAATIGFAALLGGAGWWYRRRASLIEAALPGESVGGGSLGG